MVKYLKKLLLLLILSYIFVVFNYKCDSNFEIEIEYESQEGFYYESFSYREKRKFGDRNMGMVFNYHFLLYHKKVILLFLLYIFVIFKVVVILEEAIGGLLLWAAQIILLIMQYYILLLIYVIEVVTNKINMYKLNKEYKKIYYSRQNK